MILSRFNVNVQYSSKHIHSTEAGRAESRTVFAETSCQPLTFSPRPISTNPTRTTTMGRYPWAEILLLKALHIIICYPTPHHAYRVAVLPAIVYITVQIFLTPEVTDPLVLTYTVGCTIACQIIFTSYLLFAGESFPDNWRRVRDEVHGKAGAGGSDGLPSSFPFTKKFWWMVDIANSPRMIGWVQEPQNGIPPHPPPSRRMFIRKTFFKLITNIVIRDLAKSLLAQSPAFDYRLHDPTDGPEMYLAAVPLLRRAPYVAAYFLQLGSSIKALHNAAALVFVGLGLSSPPLWPDMLGRWGDAYTLRKFWGHVPSRTFAPSVTDQTHSRKTWHQQLRPVRALALFSAAHYSENIMSIRPS